MIIEHTFKDKTCEALPGMKRSSGGKSCNLLGSRKDIGVQSFFFIVWVVQEEEEEASLCVR